MSTISKLSPCLFLSYGREIVSSGKGLSTKTKHRTFMDFFSVTPLVSDIAWRKMGAFLPQKSSSYHLLWILLFIKIFANEHAHVALNAVDEDNFRLWARRFVSLLRNIRILSISLVNHVFHY